MSDEAFYVIRTGVQEIGRGMAWVGPDWSTIARQTF